MIGEGLSGDVRENALVKETYVDEANLFGVKENHARTSP